RQKVGGGGSTALKEDPKNRSRATTAIATSNPSRARSSRSIRKDLIAIGSVVIELGQGQTAPEAAMASAAAALCGSAAVSRTTSSSGLPTIPPASLTSRTASSSPASKCWPASTQPGRVSGTRAPIWTADSSVRSAPGGDGGVFMRWRLEYVVDWVRLRLDVDKVRRFEVHPAAQACSCTRHRLHHHGRRRRHRSKPSNTLRAEQDLLVGLDDRF